MPHAQHSCLQQVGRRKLNFAALRVGVALRTWCACSEDGEDGEDGEESEDGYGCDGYGYDEDYSFEEYHPLDEPPASAPIITIF